MEYLHSPPSLVESFYEDISLSIFLSQKLNASRACRSWRLPRAKRCMRLLALAERARLTLYLSTSNLFSLYSSLLETRWRSYLLPRSSSSKRSTFAATAREEMANFVWWISRMLTLGSFWSGRYSRPNTKTELAKKKLSLICLAICTWQPTFQTHWSEWACKS